MARPFKIKHYRIVGIVASIMSGMMVVLYLIPNSGCELTKQEWIITGGWIALGVVFYIWSKIRYKDKFASLELHQ